MRVFLIFWDEYHIDQFGSAVRAREQLTHFVLEAFGPTDLVALMDQLTPVDALRFTRDRRALADQVHRSAAAAASTCRRAARSKKRTCATGRTSSGSASQVTTTALKSAVMHLGTLRQGRKAVVFVSEGLGRLGPGRASASSPI